MELTLKKKLKSLRRKLFYAESQFTLPRLGDLVTSYLVPLCNEQNSCMFKGF